MSSASVRELEVRAIEEEVAQERDEIIVCTRPHLRALGSEPIRVSPIEFRLFQFLSQSPYRAFTRKQIAESIDRRGSHVSEDSLDDHIASLRQKLGILSDFVQSVPYIGYRFKP